MSWRLWAWQRAQQFIGAMLALAGGITFLWVLAGGHVGPLSLKPADQPATQVTIKDLDDPRLDHAHIAVAIGSCRWSGSPLTWSTPQLAVLKVQHDDLRLEKTANDGAGPATTPSGRDADYVLTPFEQAAIYQSDRVSTERRNYVTDTDKRQARLRWYQISVLLVSAAAAFLVGLKTLVLNKDDQLPFRSLVAGALLPISIFALLMPVIGTAMSGVIAFDDDASVAVRDARTVAQLEQLHGRIAQDVIGDPHLCQMDQSGAAIRGQPLVSVSLVSAQKFDVCLQDRFARTVAWEQRHEQILNDATQTLAHAGDLPHEAKPVTPAQSDPCDAAFEPAQDDSRTASK